MVADSQDELYGAPEDADEQQPSSKGQTAILPKSAFAGKIPEPGETVTVQVLRVNENDVEVKLGSPARTPQNSMPMDEMSALME